MKKIPDGTYSIEENSMMQTDEGYLIFKIPFEARSVRTPIATIGYKKDGLPMLTLPQRKSLSLEDIVITIREMDEGNGVKADELIEVLEKLSVPVSVSEEEIERMADEEAGNNFGNLFKYGFTRGYKSALSTPSQGMFTRDQMERAFKHGVIIRGYERAGMMSDELFEKHFPSFLASLTPSPKEIEVKDNTIINIKY